MLRRGVWYARKSHRRKEKVAESPPGLRTGDTVRLNCQRLFRDGAILLEGAQGTILSVTQQTYRITFRGAAAPRRIGKQVIAAA